VGEVVSAQPQSQDEHRKDSGKCDESHVLLVTCQNRRAQTADLVLALTAIRFVGIMCER